MPATASLPGGRRNRLFPDNAPHPALDFFSGYGTLLQNEPPLPPKDTRTGHIGRRCVQPRFKGNEAGTGSVPFASPKASSRPCLRLVRHWARDSPSHPAGGPYRARQTVRAGLPVPERRFRRRPCAARPESARPDWRAHPAPRKRGHIHGVLPQRQPADRVPAHRRRIPAIRGSRR